MSSYSGVRQYLKNTGYKMDPVLKAKWVEALRSGEYVQGTLSLIIPLFDEKNDEGETLHAFCCLGVLCDVVNPEGWLPFSSSWEWQESPGEDWGCRNYPPDSVVPSEISCWLGDKNDEDGWTYEHIAKWVEANL